jgi:predicted nucleic acid-binding protein
MIVADSSVWIDYLRGKESPQVALLDGLLGNSTLAIGDLILLEVLQGCNEDRQFRETLHLLSALIPIEIGGEVVAVEAARNFRRLRALGITVRKTIDTLIATRCIMDGHALLFSDRDYQPFVDHLGLVSAMGE